MQVICYRTTQYLTSLALAQGSRILSDWIINCISYLTYGFFYAFQHHSISITVVLTYKGILWHWNAIILLTGLARLSLASYSTQSSQNALYYLIEYTELIR